MKKILNEMKLRLPAKSVNESVTRSCISAFVAEANPTVEELCDLRCAVSEAVTNCIVHAYGEKGAENKVVIECLAKEEDGMGVLHIKISDFGCGIEDVEKALSPFYTTLEADERSGMGFTIMQAFTDGFSVTSQKGKGTVVEMLKRIGKGKLEEFSASKSVAIGEREMVDA